LTGDPVTVSMSGDSGLSKLSPVFPKFDWLFELFDTKI
jgi:hypothetical protein